LQAGGYEIWTLFLVSSFFIKLIKSWATSIAAFCMAGDHICDIVLRYGRACLITIIRWQRIAQSFISYVGHQKSPCPYGWMDEWKDNMKHASSVLFVHGL
jgi:hypothetical protein